MFEHFTEPARQVVMLAEDEARLMRHARVGTEHLLVALARAGDPVLLAHGLGGEQARAAVVQMVGLGEGPEGEEVAFSPAAQDALDGAWQEAMKLGHDSVEPAHLLLAALRPQDGLARRVLIASGASLPEVRAEILRRLAEQARATAAPAPATAAGGGPRADGDALLAILARQGAVAAWLRERGVDEQAVRRMLGDV